MRFLFFLLVFLSLPLSTEAAFIELFQSDIDIQADSTVLVTEEFRYNFTNKNVSGITRILPLEHPEGDPSFFKNRRVEVSDVVALIDGDVVAVDRVVRGTNLELTIKDPSRVFNDVHVITLSYTLTGAISFKKYGSAEFYRNVTGSFATPVSVRRSIITLHAPEGVFTEGRACYMERYGLGTSCASFVASTTSESVQFTHGPLDVIESLIIAQSLDGSKLQWIHTERFNIYFYSILAIAGLLLAVSWYLYAFKYKDQFDVATFDARTNSLAPPENEPEVVYDVEELDNET